IGQHRPRTGAARVLHGEGRDPLRRRGQGSARTSGPASRRVPRRNGPAMILAAQGIRGFEIPLPVIVLGTIIGLTYGLLAVGLVLIYRSNRIINFAHGEIGAFAAAVLGLAVTKWHVPYYAALPIPLGLGGVVGVVAEVAF